MSLTSYRTDSRRLSSSSRATNMLRGENSVSELEMMKVELSNMNKKIEDIIIGMSEIRVENCLAWSCDTVEKEAEVDKELELFQQVLDSDAI